MHAEVYKDFFAIRFIRCVSPVPNAGINAAGAGFTLGQAIAKCESEIIERDFELHVLNPKGISPVGIAAHISEIDAHEKAKQEAVETLCLNEIHSAGTFRSLFHFRLFGFSFGIARTSEGYFSMMLGSLRDEKFATYSAARTVLGTIVKTWEEYCSVHFFKPRSEKLKKFTKANYRFSQNEFESLSFQFDPNFVYRPQLSDLKVESARRSDRHIVYLFNNRKSQ